MMNSWIVPLLVALALLLTVPVGLRTLGLATPPAAVSAARALAAASFVLPRGAVAGSAAAMWLLAAGWLVVQHRHLPWATLLPLMWLPAGAAWLVAARCGLRPLGFSDAIVPVEVPGPKGSTVVTADEHPRPGTTAESLGKLKPMMARQDAEATVTAGNASGQNDGASACIVTTAALARELGLTPLARMVTWSIGGVEPGRMGIGPVPATAKALDRAGLTLAQMDVIELNEAFASQVLACTREWKFGEKDFERMNVNGSGISLGHPVGATGGRILSTLLHEMHRRGSRYGLETMCIGGGQGISAVFERVGG